MTKEDLEQVIDCLGLEIHKYFNKDLDVKGKKHLSHITRRFCRYEAQYLRDYGDLYIPKYQIKQP
jgi:hypothetical protein